LSLHVGSTLVVDVKLAVGTVTETMTVEANPIQVEYHERDAGKPLWKENKSRSCR